MIRSVPVHAQFSFRRMGAAAAAPSLAATALSGGISAGVQLATAAVSDWMGSIQLSHNADTATTLIVNGLAQQLANLDAAYFAEPNVTCADQRAALDAYDQAWMWLQSPQACGAPSYGAAGNRCISDRAPGGKYPWQQYYRDPIANDPRLAGAGCDTGQQVILPSVTTGQYQATAITSTGGSSQTGQTPAQVAAAAVANSQTPAPAVNNLPATVAGIPTTYAIAFAAVLALFALRG